MCLFLGSVLCWHCKPEISNSHIKVSGAFLKAEDTIISCNHRSEFLLLVLPLLSSPLYHPLLSCSSLVLTSLLKAPWWFLFWSLWFFCSEGVPGHRMWVLQRDRCALQHNSSEIKKLKKWNCPSVSNNWLIIAGLLLYLTLMLCPIFVALTSCRVEGFGHSPCSWDGWHIPTAVKCWMWGLCAWRSLLQPEGC